MNMLLAEPQKTCYAGMDSENWDPNFEELQQEGRVKNLVKVFENMKLPSETQKNEVKDGHKESNKKDKGKAGRVEQDNLKSNGCVKRWASSGMDQPLAQRQPNISSGKNYGSFDCRCNMGKYEDGGNTSDLSDSQSLRSSVLSGSSSRSRRRTEKSFDSDSTKIGSPMWKKRQERHKRQVRVTPTRPFRLLTEIDEKYYSLEQEKLEEEHLQKLAELEEIRRLRREMIPYAQLMPSFDHPFVPKKSLKPPTIPKEPKFQSYHHTKGCNPVSRMKRWFSKVGFTGY